MQDITDNKKFCKIIRTYFSETRYNQTKIVIVDKYSIITDEKKIAALMNDKHREKLRFETFASL